jgi:hypothetical protein
MSQSLGGLPKSQSTTQNFEKRLVCDLEIAHKAKHWLIDLLVQKAFSQKATQKQFHRLRTSSL